MPSTHLEGTNERTICGRNIKKYPQLKERLVTEKLKVTCKECISRRFFICKPYELQEALRLLEFFKDRLVHVYDESAHTDYISKAEKLIEEL